MQRNIVAVGRPDQARMRRWSIKTG
jgi:hypothetical protein